MFDSNVEVEGELLEELVRYEGSLNRSSALGVGVRGGRRGRARDSRASLNPAAPLYRAHGLQSGDNLAHTPLGRSRVQS